MIVLWRKDKNYFKIQTDGDLFDDIDAFIDTGHNDPMITKGQLKSDDEFQDT